MAPPWAPRGVPVRASTEPGARRTDNTDVWGWLTARLSEEISQSGLAELADVGRQWLNAFEMGDKASAPLDMVMRVALALDTSVVLSRPAPFEPPTHDAVDLDDVLDRLLP